MYNLIAFKLNKLNICSIDQLFEYKTDIRNNM